MNGVLLLFRPTPDPTYRRSEFTPTAGLCAEASGQEASSAADKRAAYAEKLRKRTGGLIVDGRIVAGGKATRAPAAHERPADANAEVSGSSGASWHLQPGARDLLTYCDMRNITRLLLPFEVDSDEDAIAQGAQLARALQVADFGHVLSCEEAAATRRGEPSAIVRACATLELQTTANLMLVSDQSAALRAAKSARVFTCFFLKRLPGAPTKLPADFHARGKPATRLLHRAGALRQRQRHEVLQRAHTLLLLRRRVGLEQ